MRPAHSIDRQAESREAASRFVSGSLQRLRIRSLLSRLLWEEETCARPRRSIDRELQEMWPPLD